MRATERFQLLSVLVFSVCLFSGCAHFSTTQTDISYENGQPTRQITTRAQANTFFDSKSALAQFKATQTDKTQSASVGSLTQEANGSNVVNLVESIARGVAAGLKP